MPFKPQITNDPFIDEIECPICDFNYNRVRQVTKVPDHDDYKSGWNGRGGLIVLDMVCENDHEWQLCIGFHKGMTYIFGRKPEKPERQP